MAMLLNEIAWLEPLVPPVEDPAWEAEARKAAKSYGQIYQRTGHLVWLRKTMLALDTAVVPPFYLTARQGLVLMFVVGQENACRYCYGSVRAMLRMMGFSERQIIQLERDTQTAELDEKQRAFIEFARSLARSRPRPVRGDIEQMLQLGFDRPALAELAVMIAFCCFYNRVATFIACPPELKLERFAGGTLGRVLGLFGGPLFDLTMRRAAKRRGEPTAAPVTLNGPFAKVVAPLQGMPHAAMVEHVLTAAFASPVLPQRTKALIFAVVARTMSCTACEAEACAMLTAEGMPDSVVAECLTELDSPELEPYERSILMWARETVHYQPEQIQAKTRELAAHLSMEQVLEAVGIASLANATVRLAMLST